jgi:hypothetical protein
MGVQETLGPEVMMGTVKVEEIPEGMADMLGVSSKYVRSAAERQELIDLAKQQLEGQDGQPTEEAIPAG